jgi:UDP-N-acetylmuramate dehydrogenase
MSDIKEDFPLLKFNTFHIAAKARFFINLTNISSVHDFLSSGLGAVKPRFVLGGGSNVLFTKDFEGVILHPVIRGIEKLDETDSAVLVRVGAGEEWDGMVEYCVSHGWSGVENLSLIPGTVGASPVQNIGAYGAEAKNVIELVEYVNLENGKTITLAAKDCRFSYRDSIFKKELKNKVVITHVTFRLDKSHHFITTYPDLERELENYPETNLRTIRQAVISIRRHKLPDPAEIGNAGSFFKNPVVEKEQASSLRKFFPNMPGFETSDGSVKLSAAWLIEQCGWKGKKIGKAGTHKKQPLILVNLGGATGKEILQYALKIQKAVMNHFAIKLDVEVNVL